ncbi:MAG: chromosome segregation protein SMC, partial [Synergistota bacterium]|nr:chromosome segregation protein SMC [Synergistota bacterium]
DKESRIAEKRRVSEDVCRTLGARLQSTRRTEKETTSTIEDIRDEIQARGYPPPVRHLLSAVRLGRLGANPRVLADVVTCPPEFSCALSSYLGGRMYWLLVKDIDESGLCIEELKKARGGRATFLSLERARPRKPERTTVVGGDVLGWACDILEIEETWKPCVLHVLGDLLFARTFEASRDIVRGGARFPVVTLEGDVFQPGGAVSGGSRAREGGIFDLRGKLEKHESRLREISSERNSLEERLKAEETAERNISEELEKTALEIKGMNSEIATLLEEENSAHRRLEALEKEKEDLRKETAVLGRGIYTAVSDIAGLRRQLSETGEQRDDAGMLRDLDGKRSEAALAMERRKAAGDILERIRDERDRAVTRFREHETRLEETARSEDSARLRLKELGKRYFGLWNDLSGARADWSRSNGEYLACEKKRRLAADKLERANHRLGGLDVRLAEIRQKRESLQVELAEMRDLWEERYPFPGRDMVDTQDLETIRRNVRNLEKALRKLGDVNMGVLSEEESLGERISFLDEQLDDVGTSMEELRRLLAETDEHAGKLFSTSLTQIDARFCDLFKRLFEGGEAHLRLSEAESIWEAGVEVIARPPGKKPQHLGQLSGGEQSLSAISLLFAAMDVAGAPVAVLDEVDAALDEVNLGRFSELAREYSKSLQIICMTHRRATMERADLMYGVTMSEPGLSQVVGVRLGDWD